MALQGSYDIPQGHPVESLLRTYGDVNLHGLKKNTARYYFDVADIERIRDPLCTGCMREEANLALEKGLVLPAHDYILKMFA